MKAKVQLTDRYSGRSINLICELYNIEQDRWVYDKSLLTPWQHKKIEDYFGKMAAYYTRAEIIKIYQK